jgi:nucleoside-diphosphate-sugar epimerase
MRKILITGGAGFVGRHFTEYFLRQGDTVCCVDSIAPLTGGIVPEKWPLFNPRNFDGFKFFHEDCRHFFTAHNDTDFDYALHCAAMVGGRLMIENNPLAVADDLAIDASYWQWAMRTRPHKTVCFSSSAVYPIDFQRQGNYRLLSEEMISFKGPFVMPDMTYGWAKLTCEYLATLGYEKHGLKSVVYRPFSGYGNDQDDAYPFPSICKRVLQHRGEPEISVWGTGDQMRDFIHIDDCVAGVTMTMDKINDAGALNLSTGTYTSFKQFAVAAANELGWNPGVKGTSDTPEGVFARGGATEKQRSFGFTPAISFQEGIRRALAYFQERLS